MSADVRSIAAVTDWRADLTNYSDPLAEAMAGVEMEIHRAQDWLEEQLARWKRAIRDCEEDVTRAKAEWRAAKIPQLGRARAGLYRAREKLAFSQRDTRTLRKKKSRSAAAGLVDFRK